MKPALLWQPALGLIAAIAATGCQPEVYPQYTGTYELDESQTEYSDPEFKGEFEIPKRLTIYHLTQLSGQHFNHFFSLEFAADSIEGEKAQASGRFKAELDQLTAHVPGEPTKPWTGGIGWGLHSEKVEVRAGVDCFFQYTYRLALETTPSHEIIKDMYERVGSEAVPNGKGMELSTSIDPNRRMELQYQVKESAIRDWEEQLAKNDGEMEIRLVLTRTIDSALDGTGTPDNTCYLPEDPEGRKRAQMIMVYRGVPDTSVNLLEHIGDQLPESTLLSFQFFGQLISGMK